MLQQTAASAEHMLADSVSGSAITRALSAAGVVNWKIAVTIVIAAFFVGAAIVFLLEWNSIRKAGGLKKWVDDVPVVQYRTVRLIWLSEATVVVLTIAVVSHAVWPQVVGEVQTDMVYAIFAFLGFGQGMNVTAFLGKRATEDPVIAATNAALNDPTVQPLVTSNRKTGERTVTVVPSAAAAADTAAALAATAERQAAIRTTTERPVVVAPPVVLPPPVITRDA